MTEDHRNNDIHGIYSKSYVQSLLTIIEEQNRTISERRGENAQLKAYIAELEARLNENSRNSNRPPSMDGFRRPGSQRKRGERPPGGQNGHEGHTLDWVATSDEVRVHRVSVCEECGTSLEEVEPSKVERRQVHDIPALKVMVVEHQAEEKTCPCCGRRNRAPFPPEVRYPVQYGQNLKSLMVYLSIYQLIPYERICDLFTDLFNRSLSKATLVKAVSECSQELTGFEEDVRDLLVNSPVLHVDETGMRVCGIRQWLHVASTEILTWYGHHRKRGSRAMDDMQILPRFRGTMVHDFWSPYFRYPSRHALCNAHLLRELKGISENYHQTWSGMMYDLIQEIKESVDEFQDKANSLPTREISIFTERYRQIVNVGREENSQPSCTEVKRGRGRKKQSRAKNLLDRCTKFEREILSFMHDFSIPFSNNQAERDIRMMKLQQKVSDTFRSEEGARSFCRVRGYISTVRKNHQPVLPSLVGAFRGDPFCPYGYH